MKQKLYEVYVYPCGNMDTTLNYTKKITLNKTFAE